MRRITVNLSEKSDTKLIELIDSMTGDGTKAGEALKQIAYASLPASFLIPTLDQENCTNHTRNAHESYTNHTRNDNELPGSENETDSFSKPLGLTNILGIK